MLRNRGLRLVSTIVLFIVLYLLCVTLPSAVVPDFRIVNQNVQLTLILLFAVTLILQILGDILNFSWANDGIVALIKRIIFDALAIGCCIVGVAVSLGNGLNEEPGFLSSAFQYAAVFSAPVLAFLYLIATTEDFPLESVPFYMPASFVGTFILGLIASAIFGGYSLSDTSGTIRALLILAIFIAMIIWRIKVGGAFSEFGEEGLYWKNYTPSSTGSTGRTGSTSGGGSGSGNADAPDGEMKSLARSNSGIHADGNDTLAYKAEVSRSYNTYRFTVTGAIHITSETKKSLITATETKRSLGRYFNEVYTRLERQANDLIRTKSKSNPAYGKFTVQVTHSLSSDY